MILETCNSTNMCYMYVSVILLLLLHTHRVARKTPPKPTSKKPQSKPQRRKSIEGRDKGEGSRSRLPSITSLQEKLKRRWPMSVRSKEAPEVREHHTSRFWRSAPRVVGGIVHCTIIIL